MASDDEFEEYLRAVERSLYGPNAGRRVLTAILWVQPMPCPHELFASLGLALDWADKGLEANGLRIDLQACVRKLTKALN